jgi:hypothetical protein
MASIKKPDVKAAATLVIHRRDKLSEEGRKDISMWLFRQAMDLWASNPIDYSPEFKATYWYTPRKIRTYDRRL